MSDLGVSERKACGCRHIGARSKTFKLVSGLPRAQPQAILGVEENALRVSDDHVALRDDECHRVVAEQSYGGKCVALGRA